ncbi:MAG: alpha/beta fold hydrolase [Burkholderiaceae bacterium]|nr:alpha/beta fold hydrolase [Burkholderiaceae bacterium]
MFDPILRRVRPLTGPLMLMAGLAGCAATAPDPNLVLDPAALSADARHRRIDTVIGAQPVLEVPGPGMALVLWPSVFASGAIHADLVRAFAGRYRLLVVEPPLPGPDGASADFTLPACAQAVSQILDAYGIDRAAIIGTSWGGLVGVHFAHRYPARTAGLVLLNTPFDMPASGPGIGDRLIAWAAGLIGNTDLFINGVARSFFSPSTRETEPAAYRAWRDWMRRADKDALAAVARSVLIDRGSTLPLLAGITAPALVIAGTDDAMYPVASLADATARMPNARFQAVAGAHHIAAVDRPDDVAREVGHFLAGLPRQATDDPTIRESRPDEPR